MRKAINYALNRTQILQQWGGPLAGTPYRPDHPGGPGRLPATTPSTPTRPDLAKAKQLMAAAGVKTPVTLVLRTQNDAPGFINMARGHPGQPQGNRHQRQDRRHAEQRQQRPIITNYKTHTPLGIEPWSLDFPDGEAIINTGLDPTQPDGRPQHGAVR